jgi:hypothetical protein
MGSLGPGESVFGEDGGAGKTLFEAVVQVFFPWHLHPRPVAGTDTDDTGGTEAFNDEVGLEPNLDTAAAERSFTRRLDDIEDGTA